MQRIASRICLLIAIAMFFASPLMVAPKKASAVTGASWQAGRIIDDLIFTDKNSMSVAQIQDFLNSKVGTGSTGRVAGQCDSSGAGTSEFGDGTRANYGADHGNPAPFTCLKDYYEVPKTQPGPGIPANNYGGKTIPAGAESAAQLIWDAAQRYNISPKVLLVTIQKESAGPLITDDWPFLKQYTYAMGAHCPDSGPGGTANCDSNYAGFSIQISESAALFRYYLDNMGQSWWPYKKPGNNDILYNPSSSCGSSTVNIVSKATAALYTYTPYQPNAAALANMYTTGDSCSSYGNRNFWRIYNDWFGPTNGSPFFSINTQLYILGANNTYYAIPNQAILKAYGFYSKFGGNVTVTDSSFTSGMTYAGLLPWIARFESNAIYVVDLNGMHHFQTAEDYQSFGYTFGQEAVLPGYLASSFTVAEPMDSVVKQFDRPEIYFVANGKRSHISTYQAFTTMGSPIYSTQPWVPVSAIYASSIPEGIPITNPGEVIQNSDNGQIGVWINNQLEPVQSSAIAAMNLPINYSRPSAIVGLLPASSTQFMQYVQDSNGKKFIIDGGNKLSLSADQLNHLIGNPTFQTVPDTLLNSLPTIALGIAYRQVSSPNVYMYQGGKLYHINSEADLKGLGLNWSMVQVIKNNPAALFADSGGDIFANGRLLRVNGTPAVYIVDGILKKRHVTDEQLMSAYGFSFNSVALVGTNSLSGYTDIEDLDQYMTDGNSNYWVVDTACKRRITTSLITEYGKTTAQFLNLSSPITSGLSTCADLGNLIRADGQPKVYKIAGGTKHWITSESALYRNGFNWSQVQVVSPRLVNSIPVGSDLQ